MLVLVLATASGLLLAFALMSPPAREMWELALYFVASGAISLILGLAILRLLERWRRLSLRSRAAAGAAIGGVVALVNVFVVAQLMFVSTGHDLRLLAALALFGGIASLSVSFWAAAAITDRVRDVAHTVRALAEGDLDERATGSQLEDEVSQLARDVNELAERLAEGERRREAVDRERKDLTAAISHDLRTPLANIGAMVEALSDGLLANDDEVALYHQRLVREVRRLDAMIDDLFELAQLDAGALELNRRPLLIQEVAAEVVDSMQARASASSIELSLRVDGEPVRLAMDGSRMERAMANLVRNALEHTPAGGRVQVTVSPDAEGVAVAVADSGKGIDSDDLPRVWERFYRGDESRTRTAKDDGVGLGLAIVRGFVEAHGGTVGVDSAPGEGATFRILLPAGV